MKWINARSSSMDEALRQSMVKVYDLSLNRIRGNHWMNLDNGDVLWMIYDSDVYRFFRHFPATDTVVEVTNSITGGHAKRTRERFALDGHGQQWEKFIDEILGTADLSEPTYQGNYLSEFR